MSIDSTADKGTLEGLPLGRLITDGLRAIWHLGLLVRMQGSPGLKSRP